MKKPGNWENVQGYGGFEALETGGHILRIMKVEESMSRSGRPMILIYLDVAEGPQAGYYQQRYKSDTREDKKWGCIVYQLTEDEAGNASRGFKTFITSVERSNPSFDEQKLWGDGFTGYLKGMLVGGVFGREQYQKRDGSLGWAVKCMYFRDTDTILKGVQPPKDRYLEQGGQEPLDLSEEDDLPF